MATVNSSMLLCRGALMVKCSSSSRRLMSLSSPCNKAASLSRRRCGGSSSVRQQFTNGSGNRRGDSPLNCSWRRSSSNISIGGRTVHQRRMTMSTSRQQANNSTMASPNTTTTTTTTTESLLPRSPTLRQLINTLNATLLKPRSRSPNSYRGR